MPHARLRSDLFAVGVMVIEALTGERPFRGASYHEQLAATLRGDYHLAGHTPDARRLDEVLRKCLASDPSRRYTTADEMRRELVPAVRRYHARGGAGGALADADMVLF